ncbi:hypothetical protein BO70DRAFT_432791 [Aspergillus heteromorphus CBS 117.55]|uniref:Protamine P1 n=1 Tax=Aspergillus heteromorphus CBS 117.55 TaxID=1448321 RepID=A0A317V2F9_9EURO|nr:uncharacterized protein BO70DRAFT_432791 [Aspergillus heteromorphus CBS 117.55]PWY68463.1 hypothetical protein BO70DRAFT_432791 [Aspergillus heteromorphus CBS 117.55]
MPPRQTSPLSLETCSPSPPDIDADLLVGSDDELDENERAAQRQRIEKLAESYLHGTPLFILSASLRGPLEKGWVNPWRKNRRKVTGSEQKGGQKSKATERPTIPETNTRKRPLYRDSQDPHHSKPPSLIQTRCTRPKRKLEAVLLVNRRLNENEREMAARAVESSGPASALTSFQHTDERWLKKDCAGIGFRKVDPPTSPTASISSRHREAKESTIQVPGTTYRITTKPFRRDRTYSHDDTTAGTLIPDSVKAQINNKQADAQSNTQEPPSEADDRQNSLHVVSSTSYLPKFEYRRTKYTTNTTDTESLVMSHTENEQFPGQATAADDEQVQPAPSAASMQVIEADSTSRSRSVQPLNGPYGVNISDRFTSAQQVPRNPAMEHAPSLHTISAAKPHSECDADTIPDQFNTQAALLDAQKSFQNDLDSQEQSPEGTPNRTSSPTSNITPFYRMNTPDRVGQFSRVRAPGTARLPLMSTQCIIDAVTPFTFSTEKKARPRFISPQEMSSRKEPMTVSFNISSPPPSEPDNHDDPTIIPPQSPIHQYTPDDGQISPLPMAFSSTNPPTYQDGQGAAPGADSFNESQAIAEIGSWLQQSFDVNNEIQQCRNTKSGPSSSAGIGRSTVSLNTPT